MNEALKARIANAFTTLVAIITVLQASLLTSAPFPPTSIAVMGIVFTFLTLGFTIWKQYLSPDVNNAGIKITIGVAIATTLTGLLELTSIINMAPKTEEYVKWLISVLVMVINILSKQLFPSDDQKVKMNELKQETKP